MIRTRNTSAEQLAPVFREIRPRTAATTCPDQQAAPRSARRRLDFALELARKADLLEEYLESHPNRETALDRLLGDLQRADREQAEYDVTRDNDHDGLG